MSKHSHVVISVFALIFFIEGALFALSALKSYAVGFRGWAAFSFFIAFVHVFLAYSLFHRRHYAPYLAIFYQMYLAVHFIISNFATLYSPILFPSAIGVLSISALITVSLFLLRKEFTY